jgi:membrane peptidoglycan carboxypeptidase
VVPERRWSGSTIGNVPIGQGIAVTPMQMASAYAAIANRGIWVRPHLVDHVGDGPSVFEPRRRVVSRRVSKQVLAMLKNVVLTALEPWPPSPGTRPERRGRLRRSTRRTYRGPATSRRSSESFPPRGRGS